MKRLRDRFNYANVISTLCLFLLLGGATAYAANTVFSTDIVDGQVKTADLANGAATSDKLADGSITGQKILDGSIQGRDVLDNNLKGADIDESTLSNIGGGGPAGGDLTGTYPDPEIKADAVGGAEIDGFGEIEDGVAGFSDPIGGGPTQVELVDSIFAFTLVGRCVTTAPGVVTAKIIYKSSANTQPTSAIDSTAPGGVNDTAGIPHLGEATLLSLGPTDDVHVADGTFTIFRLAPTGSSAGRFAGTVSATTNLGNDACQFKARVFS